MNKPRVFITMPNIPNEGIDSVRQECNVDMYEKDESITKEELMKRVSGVEGLLCFATDTIDKDVLDAAGAQLKVIATVSVGFDHIDLKECHKRGIAVSNTPDVSADSVAEWTVMLMLCAGRNFMEAVALVKRGEWRDFWSPSQIFGEGLHDAVVGIVGMGRIGQKVLKRLLPFEVKKVLYYDAFHPIKPAEEMGAEYAGFEELLGQSDYVVCLCNLTDETRNLFNKRAFTLMKDSAVFVNCARGSLVDSNDLYEALQNKVIRAAAIDVMVPEPLPKDHQLTTLPNLIVTPHVGACETSVRIKMAVLAAENLLLGVKGRQLKTAVPM